MRRLAAVTLLALVLVGCDGDGGRVCARNDDGAELCLARRSGSYRIEGEGLQPGSEIVTEVKGKPFGQSQLVGDDGRPRGVIGLLGNHFGRITVTAVAPSGERLHVTVDDD